MKNYDFEYTKLVVTKKGSAQLDDNFVILKLDGAQTDVQFSDLATYKVERYNGVTLVLRLSDKRKLKIMANSNFCNDAPFENFCKDLEDSLTRYTAENSSSLIRRPGIFEQKWMIVFPLLFTVGTLYVIIRNLTSDRSLNVSMLSNMAITLAVTATAWTAFLKARKRQKERPAEH